MSPIRRKIVQVARRVRDQLEADAPEPPDGERVCARANDCYPWAVALASALEVAGFAPRVVRGRFRGDPHAWVVCAGLKADITLDQFGAHLPRVLVAPDWPGYDEDEDE